MDIATSNSVELLSYFLKAHELHSYFEVVITGSDGLRGKPAPDMYLEAAKRLAVKPEKCLVFEDIIPGILAGKRAGMRVCAVEDAYSAHLREEKKKMADYYIEDYYGIFN
jgi:16S rRNA pseudouridine516 synthase